MLFAHHTQPFQGSTNDLPYDPYREYEKLSLRRDVRHSASAKTRNTLELQPDLIQKDLALFADVSSTYKPSVDWLDGSRPSHPFFDNYLRIQSIVADIKDGLLKYALEACHQLLESLPPNSSPDHSLLYTSLATRPELWEAVLLAQHYGVIYLVSRLEARDKYHPIMVAHPDEADAVDYFLRTHDAAGIRAINYAVYKYITHGGLQVDYATAFVPPNAISSLGERHVVVREADFTRSVESVLAERTPLWDLHDFAHLSCATLCPPLFGNKYQTHLTPLPKQLTALVRSPGMRLAKGPKLSDGIVFSELLTAMFTDEIECGVQHTYASLTSKLAGDLADYLLARRGLRHLSTGTVLMLPAPITTTQLAILVQNKSYELPASEIEQRVFTRGGPVGSRHDILLPLTARQRVKYLAESKNWLYFEVRNTIKHRAHKEAYRIVCEELMERIGKEEQEGRELLEKVRRNILYEDWREGKRVNLWDLFA
ncbi:hypothetical protein AOQ84DRAFT_402731 [Glonium stellatum]|uniref:Uncharacterized protein n=1 Tax=Glonium stellatum TaxID=574774 RepID=A0A8E2F4D0_9PEZI|nr:hypothetical protein AOQ84DRAFT_402731 [Glonium stellatum]